MTLCVAWNNDNNIHFASDSRISSGDKFSDYGIKIIPVPIKIFAPTSSKTGETKIAFEKTYGMCLEGSFTGAYVVREFLFITLQRLQYAPGWIEVSFNQICKIVNKFYVHLAQKIKHDLDYDHSINFLFAGYCPIEKKLKIAKFFIELGENIENYIPKYEVFSSNNFMKSIGSGEEKFKEYFNNIKETTDINFKVLQAIKQTIDKGNVGSVGGNIQYGRFNNRFEFTTFGITDYKYNEEGLLQKVKYCIAGIDMNGDEFESKDSELHIKGSFIDPFKKIC